MPTTASGAHREVEESTGEWRDRLRSDRGAANMFLVPAIAGVLAATILVITVLGSATADSRSARTAADAAALAAANAWRAPLAAEFARTSRSLNPLVFWSFPGTDIGSFSSVAVRNAARDYAEANDAELVAVDVDADAARVSVRVRHRDVVPDTGERMEHTATAELLLRSGACRSGRTLGYLIAGRCITGMPPAPPTPSPTPIPTDSPTPTPSPTPPPFEPPRGLGGFAADTRLTR